MYALLNTIIYNYEYYDDYYYDDGSFGRTLVLCIIVDLAIQVGFGFGCRALGRSRDISDWSAFMLGFWLGWIGLIIVATKPHIQQHAVYVESPSEQKERKRREDAWTLSHGGWKCAKCGSVNPSYMGTCSCGMYRSDSNKLELSRKQQAREYFELKNRQKDEAEEKKSNNTNAQASVEENLKVAEAITKFKELRDMGVLSDEEFEERKNSLIHSINTKTQTESEENKDYGKAEPEKTEPEEWECSECGSVNPGNIKCCSYCGKIKDYYGNSKKTATVKKVNYQNNENQSYDYKFCHCCGSPIQPGAEICTVCGNENI